MKWKHSFTVRHLQRTCSLHLIWASKTPTSDTCTHCCLKYVVATYPFLSRMCVKSMLPTTEHKAVRNTPVDNVHCRHFWKERGSKVSIYVLFTFILQKHTHGHRKTRILQRLFWVIKVVWTIIYVWYTIRTKIKCEPVFNCENMMLSAISVLTVDSWIWHVCRINAF